MKKPITKRFLALLMVLSMVLTAVPAVFAAGEENRTDVVVLYTNDTHCGVDPDVPTGSMGFANLAAYKKAMEAAHDHVTLVDAGDAIQGEAIGTLSAGSYLVEIMNYLGYDYAVFGNHEFDYGMAVAQSLLTQSNAKYLAANFIDLTTGTSVTDAYDVVDYGTLKVAYIGLATPETFTKSTPAYFQNAQGEYIYSFCEGNNGQDLYDVVQTVIDAASAEADLVIAIGHLGVDEVSAPWRSYDVIANTTGLDAFIDGHSHSTIEGEMVKDKDGNDVILTSTGTKLQNIGRMTITPEGKITTELISGYSEVDTDTDTFIKNIQAKYEDKLNEVVAESDVDLTIKDPETGNRIVRSQETNLGDLCADAYRVTLGADIAFVNGGGIRANIEKGDITYGEVIAVHPFGNAACVVEATGQQIIDALEMSSRAVPGELGGFLHVSGLKYTINTGVASTVKVDDKGVFITVEGARRVRDVQVLQADGTYAPIDLRKTYKLASHNYMLKSGGDGLNMFMGNKVLQDEVMIDNQVLITYIRDHLNGIVGSDYANPYGQGRITIINEAPSDDVVILYTNDVHCGVDEGVPEGSMGYANVAALEKEMLSLFKHVVLVDAGDAIQGEAIGTLSNGGYLVDIMNYVGYDFATFGNHEFDYGMGVALSLLTKSDATYLSANFTDLVAGTTVADPYKVVDYNGLKIAYVGVSTPETFTKSTPAYFQNEQGEYIYGFCEGNNGQDLYDAVQAAIDAASAEADIIIAIGHLGVDEVSAPWRSYDVIANTTGLDAFIDGHSHSTIEGEKVKDKDGNDVILTSTGTKLQNIGKMTITTEGKITTELISGYQGVHADTDAYIKGIQDKYADKLNEVVAESDVDLTIKDPETGNRIVRSQETNLGDLCADAYRLTLGADIAFVNGGGIRANIDKGEITYGEVIAVHPFGNAACVVEATGQEIIDALEMSSRAVPGELGGFLHVSGLKYTIDLNVDSTVKIDDKSVFVEVQGARRVKDVQVLQPDGSYAPIDLNKVYKLASHNYMLKSGGDGINMFMDNKVLQDEVMIDNQVLITYIRDHLNGVVGEEYANPYGQGRITILSKVTEEDPTEPTNPNPNGPAPTADNNMVVVAMAGLLVGMMGVTAVAVSKKRWDI